MKKKSIGWLYELENNLHPHNLLASLHEKVEPHDLTDRLEKDVRAFRSSFADKLGSSRKSAATALLQVTLSSDVIHGFLTRMAPTWNRLPQACRIRKIYRSTLGVLESLLGDCSRLDARLVSRIPLTASSRSTTKMLLKKRMTPLLRRTGMADMDHELYQILATGLRRIAERKGLSCLDVAYVHSLLDGLDSLSVFDSESVEELLYRMDFNTPSFFTYWTKQVNTAIADSSGLHRQLETLIGFEERFHDRRPRRSARFLTGDESIHVQLTKFLTEKKGYIHQRIALQREEVQDGRLAESEDRVPFNLPVAQLGLFIRLLMDNGTLPKDDIAATFGYFARHFRTPKTPFISAESLQKKSTDAEPATVSKLKGHLIAMLNQLNKYGNGSDRHGL